MVNRYLEKFVEEEKKRNKDIDSDKLKEDSRDMADFNVKWYIIKDRLIAKSEVSITDNDVDNEIKKIMIESNEEKKKIEEFFTTMPKLSHTIEVTNPNTKVKSEVVLEGLASFFA